MRNFALIAALILTLVTNCKGQERQPSKASPSVSPASQFQIRSLNGAEKTDPADDQIKWTEKAQAYSSILTLIVTILGFSFLYSQIRQARQSLNGSTHAAVYGQQHAIHQYFMDHPEFRKYFYDNIDCLPDDANR